MTNGPLHVIGVRHHSPACARLVTAAIRELRPATVLIEGPSDLNGRLDELLLDHQLPIAVYSFLRTAPGTSRVSWYPLCSYSPEWVALRVAAEVGADVRFMDLPSWHDAFDHLENRGADRTDRYGAAIEALCAATGMNGHDALWDHLFEAEEDLGALAVALERYFVEIRALSPLGERDAAREEHMRTHISDAMERGTALAVCGGFHAPALAEAALPVRSSGSTLQPMQPAHGVAETYLVPYSYARLDSFTGYQSGMPSPAYYEELARSGAGGAADLFLERVAAALRSAGIGASTADLVAVHTQAQGLARLRGHSHPLRVDLLDGLASGLLKDASLQPFPWDRRTTLHPETHPLLVAVVRTFTGERFGRLDPGTPLPPLVADVRRELERTGHVPTPESRHVDLDLTLPTRADASGVLHRLRVLDIPGFDCADAVLGIRERWSLTQLLDADSILIERSIHGPTLESAAADRLRIRVRVAAAEGSSSAIGEVLVDTVRARLHLLDADVLQAARTAVDADSHLGSVGALLDTLAMVGSASEVLGAAGSNRQFLAQVSTLVGTTLDRFLWLLEQVGRGTDAEAGAVHGLMALVRAMSHGRVELHERRDVLAGVLNRRAGDASAPPAVRGACLGALWSLDLLDMPDMPGDDAEQDEGDGMRRSVAGLRALRPGDQPGDYLNGLFATARRLVTTDDRLVRAIDELVDGWTADEFLVLLPGMRSAFAWFPPRERAAIAGRIAALRGLAPGTRLVGLLDTEALVVASGAVLDERIAALLERYGLTTSEVSA